MKNELPSTFKAYRYQQHRWSCGPANLFRKMALEILRNKVCLLFLFRGQNRTEDTIRFWIWMPRHAYVFLSISLSIVPLQKVTLWKKLYVIYSFFFVRKIVAHLVTFIFYCIVMPATVLVPEVQVPIWGAVYIPSAITILNAVGTPRSSLLLQKYLSSAWSIVWHCFALLLHFLLLFFVHSKTSVSPLFENRLFSERFFGKYLSNKFFAFKNT